MADAGLDEGTEERRSPQRQERHKGGNDKRDNKPSTGLPDKGEGGDRISLGNAADSSRDYQIARSERGSDDQIDRRLYGIALII